MFHTGDQIGTYSLVDKLGRGAFGEVWLAEEKTAISSHTVALKLPNEEDVDLEAIRQEASVWETVKGHPNILPIIKADIYEGQIYIASEYAPDGSLSEWLKRHGGKAPSVEIAVQMTRGILAGLEHLHSKGVIHRDLKPANILLQSETPRIADFGIAGLAKSTATNSALSAGTPSYMAPECFYSVRSEQTDIWAVGVLFHKLLSGKLPFAQPDQISVMNAVLNSKPEIDDEIPAALKQIIRKSLKKDTGERYQTAAEMRADLNNFNPVTLADADTVQQAAMPGLPKFEKEEVTVVRSKPAKIRLQTIETESSNRFKTLTIALASLLVLAAVTVWAAFQFGGDRRENESGYSDLSNQSNINSNFTNLSIETGNSANFSNTTGGTTILPDSSTSSSGGSQTSSNENVSTETNTNGETTAPTPFDIQPGNTNPNVNIKPRVTRTETPAANQTDILPPAKVPTPTPIEIAPIPKPTTSRPRDTKPTPRPTAQTEETPPPLKEERNSDSNSTTLMRNQKE